MNEKNLTNNNKETFENADDGIDEKNYSEIAHF